MAVVSTSKVTLGDGSTVELTRKEGVPDALWSDVVKFVKDNETTVKQNPKMVELLSEYPEQLPMVTQFSNDSDAIKNFLQSTALAQSAGNLSKEFQEAKLKQIEADPELKAMFDDIKQNGQEAFMKYLANDELMRKVSQKVGGISPEMLKHLAKIQEATVTLHEAAKVGDLPKMKEFLKDGKDVNGRDLKGITALGHAVGGDQLSAVKLLIQAKANTDEVDSAGSSAVHFAAGYGRDQILELLLLNGAAPSKANQAGLTPLAIAMQNLAVSQQQQNLGNHAAVVGILQRVGAR